MTQTKDQFIEETFGPEGAPPTGRQPTHYLQVFTKHDNSGPRGRVGVGWLNDKGQISIRLNPGVVLSSVDDWGISLWPANERDRNRNDR